MNTMAGKKGQVQYFLESAFRIGFLMIALLAFFLLINFFIINKIDTNKLQSEVLANRIMYSDTFMYKENSRSYIGIVDLDNFNEATISTKIDYSNKRHAAVKIELYNSSDEQLVKTTYLNKAQYDLLKPLIVAKGKGAATEYVKVYPVTYKIGQKYIYGTIRMNLIIPNS